MLKAGVAGLLITALCCFTPVLAVLFSAVELSALIGYLDLVLIPALVFFFGLTVYALWRRKSAVE